MHNGVEQRSTVTLTHEQLENLIESASEKGAEKALERLGLSFDNNGRKDIHDMLDFLAVWRLTKRTAMRTVVTVFIVSVLGLISLGLFVKTGSLPIISTK